MKVPIRCSFADDNTCEYIKQENCSDCDGCKEDNEYFEINEYEGFFAIDYYHKIGDLVIHRASERIVPTFKAW